MEIEFSGKIAWVTGASRGIGREIVKSLAKCGAQVIALGRHEKSLESLKNEVPSIRTVSVDLSDWNDTKKALELLPSADLLVNNAGIAILKPLCELTEQDVDTILDVNLKAVINVTQEMIKRLLALKSPGAIVNVSSQAASVGLQDHTVYCASKGGVDAFTRAVALEVGPNQIRINNVNPTIIMTDMGKLGWADPAKANPMLAKIPLRRFGEVQEVVDAVLFLLSEKASMIHGTCLPIDGGYLAV